MGRGKFYRVGIGRTTRLISWVDIKVILWVLVCLCTILHQGLGGEIPANVVRFGIHTSGLGTLDPHMGQGSQDMMFADMVFNGIVRYRPGDMQSIEPDLAEEMPSFIFENGYQTWTIKLRRGILFHKGPMTDAHELTADDVIFSLERVVNMGMCFFSSYFKKLSFLKRDRYTVEMTIERGISPRFFLFFLVEHWGNIISKRAMESMGEEGFAKHPIGTGPFQFKSYEEGGTCVLTRNPDYFRGSPALDGVALNFIPDNEKRKQAFLDGKLDVIIGSGKQGWLENISEYPKVIVDVFGPGYTGMFHLNTSWKPLDDIRVRQAIVLALDRDTFLENVNDLNSPVYLPMPREIFSCGMDQKDLINVGLDIQQDIPRAKRLLAQAGYPKGFSLPVYVSEKRLYRQNYESLKHQLERINIRLDLKMVSHSEMHRRIRRNENAIVLYFVIRSNPDTYLRRFFHSDFLASHGGGVNTNFSHFTEVDAMIDDAFSSFDPSRQIQIWDQVQLRVLDQAIVYPLLNVKQCVLRKSNVDYGHPLISAWVGYPQFTEKTSLVPR